MSAVGPLLLLDVGDITDADVDVVLGRAEAHAAGRPAPGAPFEVGLLFLASSLRTRVGFATAAARLGGHAIDVVEARWSAGMSQAETFADTLRTVSGMVDVVVLRTPLCLERDEVGAAAMGPVVNGGDGDGGHPTQALIDLFAIESLRGPIKDQVVALCGDMGARSARSMLRLLVRRPPRRLVVIAPDGRAELEPAVVRALGARLERRPSLDLADVDVLSMVGLPEGVGCTRLDEQGRRPFVLGQAALSTMAPEAIVLSPMPVIDEISAGARRDPRVRMFAQSDAGVAVRMAVLELVLGRVGP